MNATLLSGRRLGRYEIRSPIGAGGMGEVYLAHDTELRRPVALKLLPSNLTNDEDRLRRFEREAQAAAGLNHPNIAHIYEIGEADGSHFIAMEYIDGETLREKIHHTPTDLKKLLEYLTQVAEGLNKAHAAGIIHRDLKPDNIMITRDGYAKVLDFGLAKLIEPQKLSGGDSSDASTVIMEQQTQSGVIMGTVGYMSPEQARGKAIDQRSDIFSFGCILYEATAGRQPFKGDSNVDTLHQIIHSQPPPITEFNAEAPAELQRVVRKCLVKDAEQRYQTIKDVALDLKELHRELESKSESAHVSPSSSRETVIDSRPAASGTGAETATRTELVEAERSTLSVEHLVSEVKRHRTGVVVALAVLIIAATGVGFGFYKFFGQVRPIAKPSSSRQEMKVSRLTNTSKVIEAAISPDGKYVVYAVGDTARQSLWLRQVATSSSVQIVPTAEANYYGLTFSRDGSYVYYVRSEESNRLWALYQVPSVGGTSRRLLTHIDSAISFSPDGKRFAFLRSHSSRGESAMIIANADGTGEHKLATRKAPDSLGGSGLVGIAWSPDGKMIACPAGSRDYMNVIGVQVEGGTEKPLTSQKWKSVGQVAWSGDGSSLLITARDPSRLFQVWRLDYPSGESHKITNDFNDYNSISLTSDSTALVTVYFEETANIWVVPAGAAGRARQVTQGKYDGLRGLSWTPDGKIVYESKVTGNRDIWIMEADGTGQRQLTNDVGVDVRPSVSPDGRFIVFLSIRAENRTIWRMEIDGGNLKQLVSGGDKQDPRISPDGQSIVYGDISSEFGTLMKVSIDGGQAVPLINKQANYPSVSPDGKWIACYYWDEHANPPYGVGVLPFEGGPFIKTLNIPHSDTRVLRWTLDGQALMYVDQGLSNIWSQPLDGNPPKQVTDFKSDTIFSYDLSRDGKLLALARGSTTSDVVLISNFR